MRVSEVVERFVELLSFDPLGEEVAGHEVVCDLDDAALALGQRLVFAKLCAYGLSGWES